MILQSGGIRRRKWIRESAHQRAARDGKRASSRRRTRYSSRNAEATGRLAARIAGGIPPRTPMIRAKTTPIQRRSKVILKAKAKLENVWKLMVLVVNPLRGQTARQPSTPPTKEINNASKRKERTTL